MIGFATVKMPLAGSIGPDLSYFWLAANALACSLSGGLLLRKAVAAPALRAVALAAAALLGIWYLLRVDGGWPALGIYLIAGWLMIRRRGWRGWHGARA
jgi:hypothetical protein